MEGQEVGKPKKTRARYEVIIILIVILAGAVVAFGINRAQSKAEKGNLLISELEQIRSAVTMYKTLNKSNPPDLVSLTKMSYTFAPGEAPKNYLANIKENKKGQLIDPFGNPYKYDTKSGWVSCMTEGYSKW